jgi:hypothetical protein
MAYITREMYLDSGVRMGKNTYDMHIVRFMPSTRLTRKQTCSQHNSISPYHNRDNMTFMPRRISVCRIHCVIRFFRTFESHMLHAT